MKKIYKCFLGSVFVAGLLFSGCASNSKNESLNNLDNDGDFYEAADSDDSEGMEETSAKKRSSDKTKTTKKKKQGFFESFFTEKFVTFDESSIYTAQTLGSIKQQQAQLLLYPKEELFGFGSPYMAAYYYIVMDEKNREIFRNAVDKYFEDFENKKLSRTDKKSYKAYGKVKAKVFWGSTKISSPNYGDGVLDIGYRFEGQNPYMTITMFTCENKANTDPRVGVTESMNLFYYMTKNQARKLADFFNKEKLEKVLYEYELEAYGINEGMDDYENVIFHSDEVTDDVDDDEVVEVADEE